MQVVARYIHSLCHDEQAVQQTDIGKVFECIVWLYVASLLYYRKFTRSLKSKNFTMNPCDPCVWSKTVSEKQLIICFHVDDCKLLHVSPHVLDETIE